MATYGDLSKFTLNELSNFTLGQLNRLTYDEMIAVMNSKVEIKSKTHPEMADALRTIALGLAASAVYDALKQFIIFLQSL